MKIKHIHFIVNPASAKEEPLLNYINQALAESGIAWEVSVTQKNKSVGDIARPLMGQTDLIVVYGGDGCVTETAAALCGGETPMAIIPGGTANVMAKELGIPQDTKAALDIIGTGNYRLKQVDMGVINGDPFLLRINMGIMADMVLQADREMKNKIGQLAYGVSALKTAAAAKPTRYSLDIDGEKIEESGVSLTITNSGHMGIGELALQPGISITDGLLDIVLLKDSDLLSLFKAAGSALLENKTDAVKHWTGKKVVVNTEQPQALICDDRELKTASVEIEIKPASIRILVPADK